ncbi:MAG: MdtA/MuxA family multidrug efflux RND transporter periplasmic adaptor subunit [Desulfovibrionaceae bacterium]|nr:MdtA/MuxA family multidrug efflux RND transporter periplasmic adaptor subunit [Desulfovibrionaceae bacterium]MBF0512928.1 MdtA/MuxA family multidrug efflux RND transporter periplasmic adaptor subunit [Desulfovibrionaceae bacterium]
MLEPARRRFRILSWPVLVAALILAAGGWYLLARGRGDQARLAKGPPAMRAPVSTVAAKLENAPVYLTGLGSVTPVQSATIKSRVDGQLMRVDFTEGQIVAKDSLLLEIDPRPYQVQLSQAEGQLLRDKALLENTKLDLARYRELLAGDFVSKQQVDTQDSLAHQYEGAIKTDQANVDSAKLNLTYCRITAPFDGLVGLRLVDPGNMVHAADPGGLLVINQIRPINVVFTLPEDALPRISAKLAAGMKLTVEAFDREQKQKLADGTLASMDNQIDPTTGTVRLKAVFDNANLTLFPSQFVNARLLLEVLQNAVVVPAAAISRGPQGTFVYVVKEDKTVSVRPVVLGETTEGVSVVTKGLSPGEPVVVEGAERLREGAPVDVKNNGESAQKAPS